MGMWWPLVMRPARGLKISASDGLSTLCLSLAVQKVSSTPLYLMLPRDPISNSRCCCSSLICLSSSGLRCGLSTSSPRSTRTNTIMPLKSSSPFSLLAMSVFTWKASASIRSSMPEKTFPDVSSSTGLRVWPLSLFLLCISRCGFPATKNSWKIYVKYQK